MDNHIKELQREAFRLCKKVSYAGSERPPTVVTDEWFEQFAKLIVNDCCEWIENSPTTESGNLILTKSFIIDNIKGYFGVEE